MVRRRHRDHTRRNAAVFVASSLTSVLVMLYPTSTNHSVGRPSPLVDSDGPLTAGVRISLPSTASPSPSPTATAAVFTGSAVRIKYGVVQVQITVQSGHIVQATAINYPQEPGRDLEVNGFAIPALQRQTLANQSGQIDTVSGATYTSAGYRKSLQSALDAAHLR